MKPTSTLYSWGYVLNSSDVARQVESKSLARTRSANIEVPILGPLAIAIIVLLGAAVGGIYLLKAHEIDSHIQDQINEVDVLFHRHVQKDARWLNGYIRFLSTDEQLQRAWLTGDRPALLHRAQILFDDLRNEQQITHFYFHGLDQVCFLRVHDPGRFGDYIDRITMNEAVRTGELSSGLELGPLGTFTLRVVRPWIIDGKLSGYIELGEEVDGLIPLATSILDVDLVVTLDKSFLDREGWEEGMEMMGREPDWDLSPDVVVHDYTLKQVSADLLARAAQILESQRRQLFRWSSDGATYRGGVLPMLDAAGKRVGDFIVMKDVSKLEAGALTVSSVLVVLAILVALTLITLFRHVLRRIERRLRAAYTSLNAEIGIRRQKERELREHRENLEYLINTRTLELKTANGQLTQEVEKRVKAQRDLHHLNEELERTVQNLSVSNRDLQELLRVAAHDLKTPIRALVTLGDWIRIDNHDRLDDSGQANLDLLCKRACRLNNHVDRILEYAGIWSICRRRERIDLNTLIRDIIVDLDLPPNVRIDVQPDLPMVKASRTHMLQIFRNLLDNAVRHNTHEELVVTLSCADRGDFREFSVTDNGPGIEQKYFEKIFQMFQTLSPRDEIDTAGVGLAIVRRVVEIYEGQIWVESSPGQGSTFFFTLSNRMVEAKTPEEGTPALARE